MESPIAEGSRDPFRFFRGASLGAIGLSPERKESAIRFSFSEFTGKEELDYTLEALRELLPMLRRYARK